ncbi:MAG: metallophosphoesterase [Myxococcales bacterium]|nr:metallophosphoesterase [Myxococcales bacterium]
MASTEEPVRIAHFSDIHYTLPPSLNWQDWESKYTAGCANYYLGGRRRHFADAGARIQSLLTDVDLQSVDHAICSGDITQMARTSEFEGVAQLFGDRRLRPDRFTVIPGNHDRYTPRSVTEDRFARWFGALASPLGIYPYLKWIANKRIALILLDVSRATGIGDSSGLCGAHQLRVLATILGSQELASACTILVLHYGFFRANGEPDRPRHGLRDYRELLSVVRARRGLVNLVLHGHLHQEFVLDSHNPVIVCAGSATDLSVRGGWNLLRLWPERGRLVVEHREWSVSSASYVPGAVRLLDLRR